MADSILGIAKNGWDNMAYFCLSCSKSLSVISNHYTKWKFFALIYLFSLCTRSKDTLARLGGDGFVIRKLWLTRGPATETSTIDHLDDTLGFLHMLHQPRVHISLADFGSGLSAMAYLKRLPADYLKIDGQFVKNMANDVIGRTMMCNINEIAHLTGKITTAEFA